MIARIILLLLLTVEGSIAAECLDSDNDRYDVCQENGGICKCTNIQLDPDKTPEYKVDCMNEKICFPNLKQPKGWHIIELDLSNNMIQQISDCSKFLVFMQDTLEVLHLNNNPITFIEPKCFKNFTKLHHISIANTRLSTFTNILPKELSDTLEVLELQSNNASILEAEVFADFKSLKQLDVSGNRFTSIHNDAFKIQNSDGENPLSTLKIDSTKMELQDADAGLTFVKHLSNLEHLSIKDTRFDSLPIMKGLDSLKELDFSNNDEVPELSGVSQFPKLKKFSMNDCKKLTTVHNNTFSNLTYLSEVLMTGNSALFIFYDGAFGPKPKFTKDKLQLNLLNNNLKTLNLPINLDDVKKVKVAGNPQDASGWICDKTAIWLNRAFKKDLVDTPSVRCSKINGNSGFELALLSENNLTEPPPAAGGGAFAFSIFSIFTIIGSLVACAMYRAGKLPCCKPAFRPMAQDTVRFDRMHFDSTNEDPVFDYHPVTIPTEDATMDEVIPNIAQQKKVQNAQNDHQPRRNSIDQFSDDFEPNPYPQYV